MQGSGCDRVGAAIVENVDPRVGGHVLPIGAERLVAVAGGLRWARSASGRKAPPGAAGPRRRINVGDLLVGVRVALAHKAAAEQADTDFLFDGFTSLTAMMLLISCSWNVPPK